MRDLPMFSAESDTIPMTDPAFFGHAESPIHGTGAFAKSDIPARTRVVEYSGERIDKEESLRRCAAGNEFIFALNDDWDLDGSVPWNQARFLNHSCEPNCEAERVGEQIWIIAIRDIPAGEELTFNYGYSLVDYREHECRCGAAGCVGYMVSPEFFEHVKWQNGLRKM
jgi:SET domain-containing protein